MKIIKMTMSSHSKILGLSMIAALCISMTTAATQDPPGTSPFLLSPSSKFAFGPKEFASIVEPRIRNAASSFFDEYKSIARRGLPIYLNAMHKRFAIPSILEQRMKDSDKFDQYERYIKQKYLMILRVEYNFETELDRVVWRARRDLNIHFDAFKDDLYRDKHANVAHLSADDIANALIPTGLTINISLKRFLVDDFLRSTRDTWGSLYSAWTQFLREHVSDLNVDEFESEVNHSKVVNAMKDLKSEVEEYISSIMPDSASILRQKFLDKFAHEAHYKSIPLIVG